MEKLNTKNHIGNYYFRLIVLSYLLKQRWNAEREYTDYKKLKSDINKFKKQQRMQLEYKKLLKKEGITIDTLPLDIRTRINNLDFDIKRLRLSYSGPAFKREMAVKNQIDLGICDAIRDWIKVQPKKEPKKEAVNHPSHYGGADNPYEAIKVIEAWDLGFNLGNTVKYISRAGKKDAVLQELKKAAWYLQREIANLEKK